MNELMAHFIAVLKPRCGEQCDVSALVRANVSSHHFGFISSHVTGLCHGRSCPLLIRAQPGQRLRVTLWDFAVTSEYDVEQSRDQVNACVRSVRSSTVRQTLTCNCTSAWPRSIHARRFLYIILWHHLTDCLVSHFDLCVSTVAQKSSFFI